MHTRAGHVADWLSEHESWLLDVKYSQEFNRTLSELPWTVSGVRWAALNYRDLEVPEDSPGQDFWKEFHNSPVGSHEFIFLMYGSREPGFVCRISDAITDLDFLYSSAPGPRYFCGTDLGSDGPRPNFGDFAEYNGDGIIRMYFPPDFESTEPKVL